MSQIEDSSEVKHEKPTTTNYHQIEVGLSSRSITEEEEGAVEGRRERVGLIIHSFGEWGVGGMWVII